MFDVALQPKLASVPNLSGYAWLGLLLGIVMPVLSGILFPAYYPVLPTPWVEHAKLQELQFVACEVAVICWAYGRGMDRRRLWQSLAPDIQWAVIIVFGAMMASSLLISAHPTHSLLQALIQVVHLYFGLAVFHLARSGRGNAITGPSDFVRWLAIGMGILALFTAWRFAFPPPLSEIPGGKIDWVFALPGFISVRYLGIWCGAITAAALVQILYDNDNRRFSWWHLAYAFGAAFAMWSGTRAAVLGGAGTAVIFLLLKGWPTRRACAVALCLSLISFCLALLFRFDDPAFSLFNDEKFQDANQFSSGRIELWLATIERWQASPLLGWGTGSLFWEVHLNWAHTQPHNLVLQYLFSWGIIGTVSALWLLGRAVSAATAIARTQRHFLPILGLVYALIWMSMVDGALYYPRLVMAAIGGLALILAADRRTEANR